MTEQPGNYNETPTEQHSRITLKEAIALYHRGDFTAKGVLRQYIRIKLAPGWIATIKPKEIREALRMPRSTFYQALHQLAEEKEIEFLEQEELKIRRLSQILDSVPNSRQESQILDRSPKNGTPIPNSEHPSQILDKQPPEALTDKNHKTSPYSYSNSYQIFLKSLSSDEERERAIAEKEAFLKYCKTKSQELKNQVILYSKWLKANIADLWVDYQSIIKTPPPEDAKSPEEYKILEKIEKAIADPLNPAIHYDPAFKMIQTQEEGSPPQWIHLKDWLEMEESNEA